MDLRVRTKTCLSFLRMQARLKKNCANLGVDLTLFWAGRGKFAPPIGFFKINAKRLKVWIWNLLTLNKIL